MKPFHYLILGLVMIAGLAGSLLLIPGDTDLGLMYFRSHQFSDARPLLEKRFAAGDRSADVVMPLAEIYVQDGEVERAVNLLRHVQAAGDDRLALFQKVAAFQKYNEQNQDYLRTLENIERIAGSEDGLRELANQYRFSNDNAKLIPALQTLTARYKGLPEEYLELANLLAAGSRFAGAAAVMQRFETKHPKDISADSVDLFVSILLDGGQGRQALSRASEWLAQHHDPETIVRFVELMRARRHSDLAARLLTPFDSAIDRDPVLLGEWLQLEMAAGHSAEAFGRLGRWRETRSLPDVLIGPYIDLAVARGRLNLAVEAAEQFGVDRLDDSLLAALVEAAFSANQLSTASRLALEAGRRFTDGRPLLAARLAFAAGDRAGATSFLTAAENGHGTSAADRVAMATLDLSLGRKLEAVAQLSRVNLNSAGGDLLLEAARLYIQAGKPAEGAQRFVRLRTGNRALPADQAWALLGAASGEGEAVARWLRGTPARSVPDSVLRDLFYIAQDLGSARGQAALSLAAAERLFADHPDSQSRLMLARSLNAAGRPGEALPYLRASLGSGEPETEEIYTAALLGALHSSSGDASEKLKKELSAFWTKKLGQAQNDESKQLEIIAGLLEIGAWDSALPRLEALARRREDVASLYVETAIKAGERQAAVEFLKSDLAREDLPAEAREARVYALIDYAGQAEALPYMRQLADANPSRWAPAYEEALEKAGRRNELLDFWRSRFGSGELTPDEKRGIAYRLIEQGEPEWARSVFGELAESAMPDDPNVAEWLFLWGQNPSRQVLEALESRARRARGAEQAAWLNRLLEAGAPDRVVKVIGAVLPAPGSGGALFDVYVRSLAANHQVDALSAAIAKEAAATTDAGRVRQLAKLTLDLGGPAAAGPAFERLAQLEPADPEALHWLGLLDYGRARYSSAERRLRVLLSSHEGNYDDNYYYAQILWHAGRQSEARVYFGKTLRLIARMESPSVEARAARAQSLFRSGYMQPALRDYRQLIAEQPRNGELRADFAVLLLESRDYDEADDILSSGVDTGGVRVALARVQLLSSTGRLPEAMNLVQGSLSYGLQDRMPPNVAATLGALEESAGRDRLAQDIISRALSADPENEDLSDALAAVEKARAGQFQVEAESRQISGAQSEDIIRMTAQGLISKGVRLTVSGDQDQVEIRSLQRMDGSIGAFAGTVRQAEAALQWEAENGVKLKGAVFSGGPSTGGGVSVTQPDATGSTSAAIEIAKPDWDFAQSLAQHGTRDRIEVKRDTTVNSRITTQFGLAFNRYNLPGLPRAAQSVAAAGNVNLMLLRKPQISLNYSLDAEYRTDVRTLQTADGAAYLSLPLVSREVHAAGVQVDGKLARGLHATGAAGVAVDRYSGSAPYFTGSLIWDRPRHLGARIDYDRRLYVYGPSQTVTSLKGALLWAF